MIQWLVAVIDVEKLLSVSGKEIKGPVWIGEENLDADANVAVLLSTFNRPTMVVKAITSILEQTYKSWNLYIIDNNSLPRVKDVLLKFRKVPRVALYFSDTQAQERLDKYWLGVMFNIGLRKGKEEFIVPLTDDCYLLPHSIATKAEFLERNPHVMICFGGQYIIKKDGEILRIRNQFPLGYKIIKGSCVVDTCQIMVQRRLMEEVGLFNEDIGKQPYPWVDANLFDEAQARGYPLYSVGKRTDVFVEHGKSQMKYLRENRRAELLSDEIWE